MTLSLPKKVPRHSTSLGHLAIAQTFKALWASGVSAMSFSIDGAKENELRQPPGKTLMSVLVCEQARWRMHYFSGYMVELHGTLTVACVLSHSAPLWRPQIQQFDLECTEDTIWLNKATVFTRGPALQIRRSALSLGGPHGVGADAPSNQHVKQGMMVVPMTPPIRHGLPESALRTIDVCFVVFCTQGGMTDFNFSYHRCTRFSQIWFLYSIMLQYTVVILEVSPPIWGVDYSIKHSFNRGNGTNCEWCPHSSTTANHAQPSQTIISPDRYRDQPARLLVTFSGPSIPPTLPDLTAATTALPAVPWRASACKCGHAPTDRCKRPCPTTITGPTTRRLCR